MSVTSKILKKFFISKLKIFEIRFCHQNSVDLELLNLLKKWQKDLDKSEVAGTDCTNGSQQSMWLSSSCPLLATPSAYGFDESALALTANSLWNKYQCMKIWSKFSSYLEILRIVSQGSIIVPMLFNLFINDLIFFNQESGFYNFADDTTMYSCSLNFEEATLKWSNDTYLIYN